MRPVWLNGGLVEAPRQAERIEPEPNPVTCSTKGDTAMKRLAILVALALGAAPVYAEKVSCEKLKAEIQAKIEAKGVKNFSLEIVPADQSVEGKVVGTCDGGTKKIVYRRD
jgi:uncharacterized protein HemX